MFKNSNTLNDYALGIVELMCIDKDELMSIISGTILKRWSSIEKDLQSYRLFQFLKPQTLKEVVKLGAYMTVGPKQVVNGKIFH